MSLLQAAVLGTVQGFTEFLPISSSGHLVFVPVLFGWPDQGVAFDAILHLGTLLAVLVFYRKRIREIVQSFFSPNNPNDRRLGIFIALSVIPAYAVGFLMSEVFMIEIRSTFVVAISLIFWGVVLWFADWYAKGHASRTLADMKVKDALHIGVAQAIALIPGTSRSGITMTASLFGGFTKKDAADFSFLVSIPVVFVAGSLKLLQVVRHGAEAISFSALGAGFLFSLLSGLAAIWVLLRVIRKWSFTPFVVYRIVIGVLILLFL